MMGRSVCPSPSHALPPLLRTRLHFQINSNLLIFYFLNGKLCFWTSNYRIGSGVCGCVKYRKKKKNEAGKVKMTYFDRLRILGHGDVYKEAAFIRGWCGEPQFGQEWVFCSSFWKLLKN